MVFDSLQFWLWRLSFGDSKYPHWCECAGQLVWRRHVGLHPPSPQVVRNLCMQLLPLLEMYCRWELQDDRGDLLALMHRFDSETKLESHELGRSLLFMIRNDDAEMGGLPMQARNSPIANPFNAIRERLATVDTAIRDLNAQVHIFFGFLLHVGPIRLFDCNLQNYCGQPCVAFVQANYMCNTPTQFTHVPFHPCSNLR